MEESNGRVTIREVYDQVDTLRRELSSKMDDLSDELKEHAKQDFNQDLQIQELQLWTKSRNKDLELKLDKRIEQHMVDDHKGIGDTSKRVWVMWGLGLFVGTTLMGAFIAEMIKLYILK